MTNKQEVKFSQVKIGQLFEYGLRVNGEWRKWSMITYKKCDKSTASFSDEIHDIYRFKPNTIVLIEAKA